MYYILLYFIIGFIVASIRSIHSCGYIDTIIGSFVVDVFFWPLRIVLIIIEKWICAIREIFNR